MEFLKNKDGFLNRDIEIFDSKEIDFIKIFYKILVVFIVIIVICLFTIPINDSVSYQYGEIVSNNPQLDYKAPFEVIPEKTFVSKGDKVKKGDTLMIIDNASLDKDFSTTQGEYVSLEQQDKTIDIDKLNIKEKIAFYIQEQKLDSDQYRINRSKVFNELNGISQSLNLLREQERIKKSKLASDSLMYRKEVISLIDLRSSYDDYLTTRNQVIANQNQASQLRNQYSSLENDYFQKKNTLEIQISDLRATQNRLTQQKENVSTKLETQGKSIDFIQSELDKQYVISNIDGVVTSMFNENQNFNFINKGESLITVSPSEETFYARARIKEQDLKYLEVGQRAHLKLDAYYYYQYGPIKGTVNYVPDRKDKDDNFYALIKLEEDQQLNLRSGYSFKGDIILKKMVLGNYIIKKLFEKYDSQMSVKKEISTN